MPCHFAFGSSSANFSFFTNVACLAVTFKALHGLFFSFLSSLTARLAVSFRQDTFKLPKASSLISGNSQLTSRSLHCIPFRFLLQLYLTSVCIKQPIQLIVSKSLQNLLKTPTPYFVVLFCFWDFIASPVQFSVNMSPRTIVGHDQSICLQTLQSNS